MARQLTVARAVTLDKGRRTHAACIHHSHHLVPEKGRDSNEFSKGEASRKARFRRYSTSCHRCNAGRKLNGGIPACVLPVLIFQNNSPSVWS